MNKEKFEALNDSTIIDVDFAKQVSDELISKHTQELDTLMRRIQDDVVNAPTYDDLTIERYSLQLTNALYFIGARSEYFGFYDDISKANARLKYNQMYAENQINGANNAKKPTQNDNQLYAEMNSVDESMINIIYARSVKIIKGKVDAGYEMLRTLNKILSVHSQNAITSNRTQRLLEG